MHSERQLPENYGSILEIDLQKDHKTALLVNLIAVLIMFVLAIPMHFFISIRTLFDLETSGSSNTFFLRLGTLLIGYIIYIIAHEATHGVAMRLFGAQHVQFGFTGMYAYAGSKDDYFDKHAYLRIALAPLIFWGIIFTALCIAVPRSWFWVFYLLQIGNVSGAAGDLYVSYRICKLPADILVKDTGVNMTVYARNPDE